MRLWTIHPRYLDAKGIVALWREGLLAKAVLEGKTKGYRNHPQLVRFREHPQPHAALCHYLGFVLAESVARGYQFDALKLPPVAAPVDSPAMIEETKGQLAYEWRHLLNKLRQRDPALHARWSALALPEVNPLFSLVDGNIRHWERVLTD